MATFNRSLKPEFIAALKAQSWWETVREDQDLFIAIRNNYINIYYQGCSLARISDSKDSPKVEVHYKYLIPSNLKSPYVRLQSSTDDSLAPLIQNLTRDLSNIKQIKLASKPYAGLEKSGVHKIIRNNSNVIDVEVALTDDDTDNVPEESIFEEIIFPGADSSGDDSMTTRIVKKGVSAKRIDLAAFCRNQTGEIELVMYEAKIFSDSRIKAKGEAIPEVVNEQIKGYAGLLEKHKSGIEQSYRRAAEILVKLRGVETFAPVVAEVADGAPFSLNTEPRLIVFGFDADQRDHQWGKLHLAKLRDKLGDRVLAVGNPGGVKLNM